MFCLLRQSSTVQETSEEYPSWLLQVPSTGLPTLSPAILLTTVRSMTSMCTCMCTRSWSVMRFELRLQKRLKPSASLRGTQRGRHAAAVCCQRGAGRPVVRVDVSSRSAKPKSVPRASMRTHSTDTWTQRRVLRPTSSAVPSPTGGQSLLRHMEDLFVRIILPHISSYFAHARGFSSCKESFPRCRRSTWNATAPLSVWGDHSRESSRDRTRGA